MDSNPASSNEPFATAEAQPTSDRPPSPPPPPPEIVISGTDYCAQDRFYTMSIEEVQRRCCLQSIHFGVPSDRVEEHRRVLGGNDVPLEDGPSWIRILAGHFFNSITVILGIVVVISAILQDWAELGVVLFVIFFNAFLGFYQEISAEKSLQSLKEMTSGVAKVVRDGVTCVVAIDEVVVGDVVVLESGASVPADLRLIEVSNLEIDEGMLTGESVPVSKHINTIDDPDEKCAIGDRKNLAFRQTIVTQGRGRGIVCCAGVHTQMGRLATTLASREGTSNETPLQRKMKWMMWSLFGCCLILAVIVFGVNGWAFESTTILYACAVAIAILPESLVAVITVAMSISVYRMAQQKCIVRKLAALEVLGNVTDICSDKTGTLTENKMVTSRFCVGLGETIEVTGGPMARRGVFLVGEEVANIAGSTGNVETFMRSCALCSSTQLRVDPSNHSLLVGTGNPTEIAIQVLTWKADAQRDLYLSDGWKKVVEFPFDSTIKRMSVIYCKEPSTADLFLFCKGAPERLLPLCAWRLAENGDVVPLSATEKDEVLRKVQEMAALALRTICIAQRKLPQEEASQESDLSTADRSTLEADLVYLGLVGIYDPPRAESRPSVLVCQQAGIKVRMVTGDHVKTAKAIAEKLNIFNATTTGEHAIVEGPDFDKLTEEEEDALPDLPSVVGRCSPDSKVKMIKALHRRGRVVAMTGDGLNDSPSIKIADVGCAMGSGTDVTKGVADVVITDDNFSTIVKAVAEGRRISSSIRKFVVHLLSGNVAEVITLILGLPIMHEGRSVFLLSPIQILWLNMFTGSPPATGLSLDEADPDTLRTPPNTAGFFTKELLIDTFAYGFFLGTVTLMSFVYVVYGFHDGPTGKNCNKPSGEGCSVIWTARATAFCVLYLGLLLHAYNVRNTRKSVLKMKWFDNKWLWGSIAFGIVTLVPIIYVKPIARNVFVHQMMTWEWIVVLIAIVAFMVLCEIFKIVKNVIDPPSVVAPIDELNTTETPSFSMRDTRSLEAVAQDDVAGSFATISRRTE